MIGQQINLYQDRFRPQRVVASFGQLVSALVVVFIAVIVGTYWLSSSLSFEEQRLQQARDEQTQLSNEVIQLNAEIDALVRNSGLDEQIDLTARDLAAHKRALRYIQNDRENYGDGFSPFLSAMARVAVPQVWLQNIQYSYDFVYLKGSSLNEELVPTYFSRFGDEDVLSGREFDVFEVSRSEDWKVDFEIATRVTEQ